MEKTDLEVQRVDQLTSAAVGLVGFAPFVGQLAGEIISNVVPNQRVDRITKFVVALEERIASVEECVRVERCEQAEFVDVMEDAFIGASRALGEDRITQLAELVASGIKEEQLRYAEVKQMLRLLEQINDIEVVLLRARLATTSEERQADADFRNTHAAMLEPKAPHMRSSKEEFDEASLHKSYYAHLVDLGLLRRRFRKPKRGELPEFDEKTGMMKAGGHEVTRLGRMLLRYIGQMPEALDY